MRKLCARWVPHLLNADQKQMCKWHSQQCLDRFKKDPTDFMRWFVNMDETWVHHYTPKNQTAVEAADVCWWLNTKEIGVHCICWKSHGQCVLRCQMVPVNWLPWKRQSNYRQILLSNLLDQLDIKICDKKKIIFHQDNAPAHKSVLAMENCRIWAKICLDIPLFYWFSTSISS